MNSKRLLQQMFGSILTVLLLMGCSATSSTPAGAGASITYGYAGSRPVAIVSPDASLKIQMHDVTYTTVNNIWVLGGYQLTLTFPSGKVAEIQFSDFKYDEKLSPIGYSVLENGASISSPSASNFNAGSIKNGLGLYPDGENPALFLALPCSVASSDQQSSQEKFFNIWITHIATQTVSCTTGDKYIFNFEKYGYTDKPSLKLSDVTLSVNVSK